MIKIDGYQILTSFLKFEGFKDADKKNKVLWVLKYPVVLCMFGYFLLDHLLYSQKEKRQKSRQKKSKTPMKE